MQPMYEAAANSPQTTLAADIDDATTTIPVQDVSTLPPPPNIAVIWFANMTGETILYQGIDGNQLTDCIRGFQGTATAWPGGAKIARLFTAYDHNTFLTNIVKLQADLTEVQTGAGVTSVNGQTGAVTIDPTAIGAAPSSHTHGGDEITSSVASAVLATKLANARTITLIGDTSGSALFDGSVDVTLDTVVADDSHNHTLTTLLEVQTALDTKADKDHIHDGGTGGESAVLSVNGQIGEVVLGAMDVGAADVGHAHEGVYEPTFVKNTAFNRSFGTNPGTVCEGNDPRITGPREPTAHQHPVGEISGLQTELDARSPSTHTHGVADVAGLATYTDGRIVEKCGQPSGICELDADGKIYTARLPSLAFSTTHACASEAEQLALTVAEGHICIRSDLSKTYVALNGQNTSMDDWAEMATPGTGVLSINGLVGTVTLGAVDVGAATATHTHPGVHCFEIDLDGGLMPSEIVSVDDIWESDINGDLQPRVMV